MVAILTHTIAIMIDLIILGIVTFWAFLGNTLIVVFAQAETFITIFIFKQLTLVVSGKIIL